MLKIVSCLMLAVANAPLWGTEETVDSNKANSTSSLKELAIGVLAGQMRPYVVRTQLPAAMQALFPDDLPAKARLSGKNFVGTVQQGVQEAGRMGCPTANVRVPSATLLPEDKGSYFGTACLRQAKGQLNCFDALLYCDPFRVSNPNVREYGDGNNHPQVIETHLFDYSGGKFYGVELFLAVREQISGVEVVRSQEEATLKIQRDLLRANALRLFQNQTPKL